MCSSGGHHCLLALPLLVLLLAPVPALSGSSSKVQSVIKVQTLGVQPPAAGAGAVASSRWLQAVPASTLKLIQSSKLGAKNSSNSANSTGRQTGGGGGGGNGGSSPELLFDSGGDGTAGVWASSDAKGPRGFADPRFGQLDPLLSDGNPALRTAVDANSTGASNASMRSNATVVLGHTEAQTESNSGCGRVTSEAAGSGGGGPYATNNPILSQPQQRFEGSMGGLGMSNTMCGPSNTTGTGRGSGRGPNGAGGGGGGGGTSINIVSDRTNVGGGGGGDGESDLTPVTYGYGFGGAFGWLGDGSSYASGAAASAGTAQVASSIAASSMAAQLSVQTASSSADNSATGTGSSSAAVQQAGVLAATAASSAKASAGSKGGRRAEAAFAAAVNGTGASAVLGIACNITAASDAGAQTPRGGNECSVQVSSSARGTAVQGVATLTLSLQVSNGSSSSLVARVTLLSKVSSAVGGSTRVDTTVVSNVTFTLPAPAAGADAARLQLPDVQLLPSVSGVREAGEAAGGGAVVSLRLSGGAVVAARPPSSSSYETATKQVKGDDGKTVSTVTTRSWRAVSNDVVKRQIAVNLDQAIAISSVVVT